MLARHHETLGKSPRELSQMIKTNECPSPIRSWLIIVTFAVASGFHSLQWLFYLSVPEISKSYYMTDER